jgi:hypothetical protein
LCQAEILNYFTNGFHFADAALLNVNKLPILLAKPILIDNYPVFYYDEIKHFGGKE